MASRRDGRTRDGGEVLRTVVYSDLLQDLRAGSVVDGRRNRSFVVTKTVSGPWVPSTATRPTECWGEVDGECSGWRAGREGGAGLGKSAKRAFRTTPYKTP